MSLLLTGSAVPSSRGTSNQYIVSRDSRKKQNISGNSHQYTDQSSLTDSQHNFVPISDKTQTYSGVAADSYATYIAGKRDRSPDDIEMQNTFEGSGRIKVRSDVAVKWDAGGR